MKAPFTYGNLATGYNFTNRKDEMARLERNFLSGINTILISPRRWGKSSLVLRAAERVVRNDRNTRVVMIDMYNIRNEEEFYRVLMTHVLKAVSSRMKEVLKIIRDHLKQWVPYLSFSPDAEQEFSIGLNWNEVKKDPDEILDMADRIAGSKKIKLVICLDEFQNISHFDDPLAFQKKLRSHWQRHQNVSYCLYGSKRHMMMEVFASHGMPFYKFGDLIFLEKIETKHWKRFIVNRFRSTGKSIKPGQASRIAEAVECHPYYVQQLAQACWLRSSEKMEDQVIDSSLDALVRQMSLLFQGITEGLSTPQVHYLEAIIDRVDKLSSQKSIDRYRLGSSANVARVKKALISKEIIDDSAGKPEFLDPLYEIWLERYYFTR
jgi:hypothetical protein